MIDQTSRTNSRNGSSGTYGFHGSNKTPARIPVARLRHRIAATTAASTAPLSPARRSATTTTAANAERLIRPALTNKPLDPNIHTNGAKSQNSIGPGWYQPKRDHTPTRGV